MQPAPGSAAQDDLDALAARDPSVHPVIPQLIAMTTETYLYAASEHIGGLASLYADENVLLSPLVLGRSAIEHCAHAIWILGAGPPEPVDGRVARALLDELIGAKEALKQTANLAGEDSDDYRYREAVLANFEEAALSLFEPPIRVKRRFVLGDQSVPGHKEIMVGASRVAKTRLTDDAIRGTYTLMSNTVHPTPHAIRELFTIETSDNGPTPKLARPSDFHENLAKMVVYYFYNALTYVMTYKALDASGHRAIEEAIDALMSDLFVGDPGPPPFGDR